MGIGLFLALQNRVKLAQRDALEELDVDLDRNTRLPFSGRAGPSKRFTAQTFAAGSASREVGQWRTAGTDTS